MKTKLFLVLIMLGVSSTIFAQYIKPCDVICAVTVSDPGYIPGDTYNVIQE